MRAKDITSLFHALLQESCSHCSVLEQELCDVHLCHKAKQRALVEQHRAKQPLPSALRNAGRDDQGLFSCKQDNCLQRAQDQSTVQGVGNRDCHVAHLEHWERAPSNGQQNHPGSGARAVGSPKFVCCLPQGGVCNRCKWLNITYIFLIKKWILRNLSP